MSFALRPYQAEIISNTRRALKVHRRVMVQAATGAGKTVIGGTMLHGVAQAGKRALFVVHRQELIEQTAITLERADVDHGFCANGYPKDYRRPITLCSVGTLAARIHMIERPSLIIFDEAHHVAAASWKKVAAAYPGSLQVGLSATPERLDGKPLDHFNALVPGPSVKWLIEEGWLTNYQLLGHPASGLADVKMRGEDFDPDAMAAKLGGKILGDAVEHYKKICPGASFVAFCCNVKHAIETRDAFRAAGIETEELDGGASRGFRRDTMAAFRDGRLPGLTSVDLFGEGVDLPELGAVILLRRSKSLALVLQWVGRVLRPVYAKGYDLSTREGRLAAIAAGPKPIAYILDHGGNFGAAGLHGFPDDDREWTLDGRVKGRSVGGFPTRTCPNCFGASPCGSVICISCGHEFVLSPREMEQIAGELEVLRRAEAAEAIRAEIAARPVYAADSFEAIFEIALARGHKVPWLYAAGVMRARKIEVSDTQYRWALDRYAAAKNYKPGWVLHQLKIRHSLHTSATEAAAS